MGELQYSEECCFCGARHYGYPEDVGKQILKCRERAPSSKQGRLSNCGERNTIPDKDEGDILAVSEQQGVMNG